MRKKLHSRLALAGLAMLAAGSAMATTGPAQTFMFAQDDNAVTANQNPAGLSRIKEPEVVFQALDFDSTSTFQYTTNVSPAETSYNSGGNTFIPLVYYATPINDKMGAGIFVTGNSISSDFGNTGPASYIVTSYNLTTAQLQGNLSYQVMDKLSLGGGLSVNYTSFEYNSNVLNLEPDSSPGQMKLQDSDITTSYVLSLLYEFSPQTRLSLVYRSKINPQLSSTPEYSGLGPLRQALINANPGAFNQQVSMGVDIPRMVFAGLYHRFDSGDETELDVGWIEASEFGLSEITLGQKQINNRGQDLNNVWASSLGYTHPLNTQWQLSAGAMYVSSAVSDQNRTFIFKPDSLWGVGVGAEYKASKHLIYGLNLNYYKLGPAKTTAYIDEINATLNGEYTTHYAFGLDFTVRWIGF
ncbi:MAG: outer membrane protein transport protein [Gammaproteobacteria bacterium]